MMDFKTRTEIDECADNAIMARELLGVLCNEYLDKSYEYHSETKAHDLLVNYDRVVALATASFDYLAKALDMYDDLVDDDTEDAAEDEPHMIRAKVVISEQRKKETTEKRFIRVPYSDILIEVPEGMTDEEAIRAYKEEYEAGEDK